VILLLWLFYLLFYVSCALAVLALLSWLDNIIQRRPRRFRIPGWRFLGASMGLIAAFFAVVAVGRPPEWRSILYEEMFDSCRDDSLIRARLWLLLGASPDGASDYVAGPHGMEFGSHVHVATSNGNCRLLRLLLEKGASPDLESEDGTNALIIAIHDHRSDLVKVLLEAGVNPHYSDGGAIEHAKRLDFHDLVPIIRPYQRDE
jgi:hypothetical protein